MKYEGRLSGRVVENRGISGMRLVTLLRRSYRELFLSARPVAGDSLESFYGRVAGVLDGERCRIVSQEVLGVPGENGRAMKTLVDQFGEIRWPLTWLEDPGGKACPGLQVWAVSDVPVQPLEIDGEVVGAVFEDDSARYCRLGGLAPADTSAAQREQARAVFAQMTAALDMAEMTFGDVIRTWFYNRDILSWYAEFNQVRQEFFQKHRVFDGLVPASTGMGGRNAAGAALTAGLLAVAPKANGVCAAAVPSPRQCPALAYGSAFSRAVELTTPDVRRLFVSGTASIDPEGRSVHVGEVDAQIEHTMDVVNAILGSRTMDWDDVTRAVVYFKHAEDTPAFGAYCARKGLSALPAVVMNDDVCRDDLLFEIEVDAVCFC